MSVKIRMRLPDGQIFEGELPGVPSARERIFFDGSIYEVEERGWIFAGSATAVFLIVNEIEGDETPPSGRYDWITDWL